MKNRLLSIIFASLLAAQLVACGSNTKEETNTNDGSDITQSESEQKKDAISETASENGETSATDEENVGMANPWRGCTEDEAKSSCPRLFKAPEGSSAVSWSMMGEKSDDPGAQGPLIQLDFSMDDMDFTARAQYGADEYADISGMYYEWTATDDVTLANWGEGHMEGKVSRYVGDDGMVDLCTWYDIEIGIAYSLSVEASDLDGFDIQAVAEQMYCSENEPSRGDDSDTENGAQGSYAPADFNPEDVYVATDQESTIDISGCDTFTQIVDKLENGQGYANATIGDADVLLVSSGTYEWEAGVYAAIDSEIFYYKDGVPTYLATVSSSGTADPLKIKDGNLYVAGHHFIFKYLIDSGYLIETEEAYEEYDETGNEIYYYKTCNSQFEDYDAQTAKSRYEELFTELEGAAVISFDTVGGNS